MASLPLNWVFAAHIVTNRDAESLQAKKWLGHKDRRLANSLGAIGRLYEQSLREGAFPWWVVTARLMELQRCKFQAQSVPICFTSLHPRAANTFSTSCALWETINKDLGC